MTRWVPAVALIGALMGANCSNDSETSRRSAPLAGTLTVLAASSLTDAFEDLGSDFERLHPDVRVEFSFGASSDLAAQIREGAPADVFASADDLNMQKVVDSDDISNPPTEFARNRLEIAVEEGNPKNIDGLDDLDRDDLIVILCAAEVPCGRFADRALANAGVSVTPASHAENVKAALALVELGEADAAIVYATDVEASEQVDGVPIPEAENVIATYPIGVVGDSAERNAAEAFLEFVTSPAGQRLLARYDFLEA